MTDAVGEERYEYDLLGRTTRLTKFMEGTGYIIGYGYNWAGELTSITYPSGRSVTQAYDAIGRLSQIQSGGANYLWNIQYNAAGAATQFDYGNGVHASFGYNDRLQLTSLAYAKGTQQLLSLAYNYGTGNNGQIQSITDNVDSTRTTTYTYDAWARLKTGQNGQWNLSWDYDRFGNRKSQNANPGIGVQLTISQTTNRVTQIGSIATEHDASGNLTKDDQQRYVYDAENRLTELRDLSGTLTNAQYTYDGNGLRVKKVGGSTTVYIFSGSKVIAEYENGALPANPTREYIYSGSQLLATIEGGVIKYHHADHLSVRVITDGAGNNMGEQGHHPFGELWYSTGSTPKQKFTSYERDAESSLDYAMFRYDSTRLGRFMTPDPIAGSIADPQSLNRYASTRNDPVNLVDPLGLLTSCRIWGYHYYLGADYLFSTVEGWYCVTTDPPKGPRGGRVTAENPSKTGPNQAAIDETLRRLRALLSSDPDCLNFLTYTDPKSGQKVSPLDMIGSHLEVFPTIGHAELSFDDNPNAVAAISGAGNLQEGFSILVNTSGAFFVGTGPNGATVSAGGFPGGTAQARGSILLHELGHVAERLKRDLGVPKAGRENDKLIKEKCKKTLEALGK